MLNSCQNWIRIQRSCFRSGEGTSVRRTNTIIVIPCYNEADRLDVERLEAFVRSQNTCALLFVDDGSTDNTSLLLKRLCACSDQIDVINLPKNVGKAEAVRQGMMMAIDRAVDHVGYWDADLATPLEEIQRFEQCLCDREQVQMVMGCRIALLGHRVKRHAFRKILGRCFSVAASWVLGINVFDTQCGAKMFRVSPDLRRVFERRFSSKWIFDIEIILRMQSGDFSDWAERYLELPLCQWREVEGSKIRLKDGCSVLWDLTCIVWNRSKIRRMVPSFGTHQKPATILMPDREHYSNQKAA